ncbi:acyl-CoA dehydrogenase family protein [Paraburkholderia sp. LEh10]|uniref:acyl-CoA dehydrogenase family protein n=1 Tax=Paraburkholderia sp. LEh10 TaxID=2821353 RepID=UPI001AE1A515|nr:acyl-CoA dehydrogenase [Paraburkholderia sp. LEh10]MBP0593293.1 acyl-CoA dehydrogenase family protein [Paraburkholderia sp. LEh10]
MNFDFTEEQNLLRRTLQSFLHDHYAFEARRDATLSDAGWRRDMWRALAQDLGLLAVTLPEQAGGFGGGAVETMIVMEELGSVIFVEPFLETCVMASGVLKRVGGALANAVLADIAAGESVIACAWFEGGTGYRLSNVATRARRQVGGGWRLDGRKTVVMAAPWASKLLVTARTSGATGDHDSISLFLVDKDAAGVSMIDYPTIDGRRASDIVFDNVELSPDALLGDDGASLPLVEQVGDEAIAAICAEAVGVLKRMQADTVSYTQERRQFGQALASFQALQHRMVDMYLQVEMAISAMYLATLSLADATSDRARAVSAAKVTIAKACRFVGQNAVQLHGAMGMTDELPLGHYFKRATTLENEFGSVDFHLARHARLEALRQH